MLMNAENLMEDVTIFAITLSAVILVSAMMDILLQRII